MFIIRLILAVALTAIFLVIGLGIFFWLVLLVLIVSLFAVPRAMRGASQPHGSGSERPGRGHFHVQVEFGGRPRSEREEKVVEGQRDEAPPRRLPKPDDPE